MMRATPAPPEVRVSCGICKEDMHLKGKRYSEEQIIEILREAEARTTQQWSTEMFSLSCRDSAR